jgi:hypothetical protein
VRLLEQFVRDERVLIRDPRRDLQVPYRQSLANGSEFVAYIDALGELDGRRHLLEWKTTSARFPIEPVNLHRLDPQLIAYSWITGIAEVSLVVFVRKREPEIQYLPTTISEQQRQEYGALVNDTIQRIEKASYHAHSGVRFPQNACLSCPCQGLCLEQPALVEAQLVRSTQGEALDWVDELAA